MVRKLVYALAAFLLLCGIALAASRLLVARASKGKLYTDASAIPHRRVALVLGCPKRVTGGWPNPFFENRMSAAAELYHQRKVDFLIVSGDNHIQGYDEPTDMKEALIERSVPPSRIYLDYAGFRTLDSVARVKEIFLQDKITVVSQRFHNERAIFLAGHHGIDAIGFDAPDVALEYALKTLLREQLARVKAVLEVYLFHTQPHFLGEKIMVGYPRAMLGTQSAPELARLLCQQLPNISTIVSYRETWPADMPVPALDANVPETSAMEDDTYSGLRRLGPYALSCLVDHLTDARWSPDPRTEPLLGAPVVGDVAYMILGDLGVPDLLPGLAGKQSSELRTDDYFTWAATANHRLLLQNAVKGWLRENPNCCGSLPIELKAAPPRPNLRMPESELARARAQLARLRPGMLKDEALSLAGKPDALEFQSEGQRDTRSQSSGLLDFSTLDHNETQAAIYFIERWADEIFRRDPLRDRYVILYFSGEGKFARMFSNVPTIPPIYPARECEWQRILWGNEAVKAQCAIRH